MITFEDVAGTWADCVDRLERSAALDRWHAAQPALMSQADIRGLPELIGTCTDRAEVDGIFGALVAQAARDGGDDPEAALVVVHLLRGGVEGLARKFRHRGPEVMALVVGELVCQVLTFAWRTSRPHPTRLLLDTKHALWNGELRPILDRRRPHEALPVDPSQWHRYATQTDEPDDVDLIDMLSWAATSGVVAADDLRLLVALEQHRGYGNQARETVAAEWGIDERTVRRRRDRALAKLRAAAGAYLSAVA